MCGLIGVATMRGERVSVSGEVLAAACDLLAHRGPDGAGVWREGHVALAHRRLAVVDRSSAGAQPMLIGRSGAAEAAINPRLVLVYNGEIYNDSELRRDLSARGASFTTTSDAQTLGEAVVAWGRGAAERLRGMYAFAAFDPSRNVLILARDPLGIKPLYWTRWAVGGREEIAFASEPGALVELVHAATGMSPRPDMVVVSSYTTTIRTTLGDRTLFQGISVVEPGQWIEVDLSRSALPARSDCWWDKSRPAVQTDLSAEIAADWVRDTITASVHAHLRSDVPLCALLSGGLDSTITTMIARREAPGLLTFVAGAQTDRNDDDMSVARECAAFLGTTHREAVLDAAMFRERWEWIVSRTGVPLSTPNEVAISHVARTLRAAGCVVTLSGEGADELFGGYDAALDGAAAYIDSGGTDGGGFELEHASWIAPSAKPQLVRPSVWRSLEEDQFLMTWYRERFASTRQERADRDPLHAHLRWQRRVNLLGLLQRLDSASMLEGVEGRTPFADTTVLELAESLPLHLKYSRHSSGNSPVRTKLVLRQAFARDLPPVVLHRPKASFPIPFAEWIDRTGPVIRASSLVRSMFSDACVEMVAAAPSAAWRLAWPLANLALWERRWWG